MTAVAVQEGRARRLLGLGPSGFHRLAYTEWGAPGPRDPAICVHGLTRNARDFDALAAALAEDRLVACLDVVGRGRSDWLADPAKYTYPQYLADANALVARLGAERVDWVGTSMGGLIGMLFAARPGSPIRRLVLNDAGPFVTHAAIARIAEYVGQDRSFADEEAVERYFRDVYAPFGTLTDAQWRHLAWHGTRRRPDGALGLAYDPAIGRAFAEVKGDIDLWPVWDAIRCPVLVLRGAESDILTRDTAARMASRAATTVVEIPGCGHAPALMDPAQIAIVRQWLDG